MEEDIFMGMIRIYTDDSMDLTEVSYKEFCEDNALKEVTECPNCHTSVYFDLMCDAEGETGTHCTILQCPKCREIIMKRWDESDEDGEYNTIVGIYPQTVKERKFDNIAAKISSSFILVYNQANAAESYNLGEFAGMGYRKAMEYLIKDYAINRFPEDKEIIIKKALSKCIDEYVTEPKIKAMAKGAVWIGNDETHYVRKWIDKDISDMKRLIDLTLYWMNFERMTEEYKEKMKL